MLSPLQEARLQRLQGRVGNPTIELAPGTYRLKQPIIIRPEDEGLTLVGDGKATITGGVRIEGWRKQGKWWVANVPEWNGRPLEFRQMWVNGRKAVRARDVEDFEQMTRILSVDKSKETIYVPSSSVKIKSKSASRNRATSLESLSLSPTLISATADTRRQRRRDIPRPGKPHTFHAPLALAHDRH